jgi:CheY-like chemotaxis protein
MIVDDDESVLKRIRALLTRHLPVEGVGFNQSTAAQDAFLADPESWSLVLTDLRMPAVDGIQLCRMIRSWRADIPIVILTAYAGEAVQAETCDLKVNAVIRKPFRIQTLTDTLWALLPPEP